ncbi:MAG: ExbD/TolR family protein [Pseudomonadota bacterium]
MSAPEAAFTRPAPRRRRPSLTPMIDVVFLLLVFFMLAARFGVEGALPLPLAGGEGAWSGPPRLVDVGPASLRLNGSPVEAAALPGALDRLAESPEAPVVLRGRDGASVQRLVTVADRLQAAGWRNLVLVE